MHLQKLLGSHFHINWEVVVWGGGDQKKNVFQKNFFFFKLDITLHPRGPQQLVDLSQRLCRGREGSPGVEDAYGGQY